jgi:hypothetical protein
VGKLRTLVVACAAGAGLLAASAVSAGAHDGGTLIKFESMTTVTDGAVGTVNDRGIVGGGKPWVITSGTGEVDRDGRVHVTVTGLVIPVAPFNGTNPVAAFGVTVSCITPSGVVNVRTATAPASPSGDSIINGTVSLPRHCKHPIVFVTSPTGAWFAMSNREDENEDEVDD